WFETGIRFEVARRPFPRVADHLPATKGAVAFRQRAHIDAAACLPIEIRLTVWWHVIAPGERPFSFIPVTFTARGHFPFSFSGQTPFGPATVAFGFKPIHMKHW